MDANVLYVTGGVLNSLPVALHYFGRSRIANTASEHIDAGASAWFIASHGDGESAQAALHIQIVSAIADPKPVSATSHTTHSSASTVTSGETPGGEPVRLSVVCPVLDFSSPETLSAQANDLLLVLIDVEARASSPRRGPLVCVGADKLLPGRTHANTATTCMATQTRQHVAAMFAFARLLALRLGRLEIVCLPSGPGAGTDKPCGQRLLATIRACAMGRPIVTGNAVVQAEAREGMCMPSGTDSLSSLRSYFISSVIGNGSGDGGDAGWGVDGPPVQLVKHTRTHSTVAQSLHTLGAPIDDILHGLSEHPWLPASVSPCRDVELDRWDGRMAPLRAITTTSGSGRVPSMGAWATSLLAGVKADEVRKRPVGATIAGVQPQPAPAAPLGTQQSLLAGQQSRRQSLGSGPPALPRVSISGAGIPPAGVGPGPGFRPSLSGSGRTSPALSSVPAATNTQSADWKSEKEAPTAVAGPAIVVQPRSRASSAASAVSVASVASSAVLADTDEPPTKSRVGSTKVEAPGPADKEKDPSKFFKALLAKPPSGTTKAKPPTLAKLA